MKLDRFKVFNTFFIAAWPNFAASVFFTTIHLDYKIILLCIGNAVYQGIFAINRLLSNPNKKEDEK